MRIYVPNLNKGGIGGGPTFVQNILNGLSGKHVFQDTIGAADIMFVPNPMWADRADFESALHNQIPVILRLDNIPEDWNNRGTSISKLRDFIGMADHIIFQSDWSRQKYVEFAVGNRVKLPKHSVVLNGVDTNLFSPSGQTLPRDDRSPVILFVKSGRNENKRWLETMEIYRRYWYQNKNANLLLVGQFADDYHRYNFGFYNGERFKYLGMVPTNEMNVLYRSADVLLFPAYADCAPNVMLESMSCGTPVIYHPYGGGWEFVEPGLGVDLQNYGGDYRSMIEAGLGIDRALVRRHIEDNFNLELMCKNYEGVFETYVD